MAGPDDAAWMPGTIRDGTVAGRTAAVTAANELVVTTSGGGTGNIATVPGNGALTNRSKTTVAATSTQLMAAQSTRRYWRAQAPVTAGVWLNDLGATAGPDGLNGSFYLAPGQPYESGGVVSAGSINYYCATGSLVIPAAEALV